MTYRFLAWRSELDPASRWEQAAQLPLPGRTMLFNEMRLARLEANPIHRLLEMARLERSATGWRFIGLVNLLIGCGWAGWLLDRPTAILPVVNGLLLLVLYRQTRPRLAPAGIFSLAQRWGEALRPVPIVPEDWALAHWADRMDLRGSVSLPQLVASAAVSTPAAIWMPTEYLGFLTLVFTLAMPLSKLFGVRRRPATEIVGAKPATGLILATEEISMRLRVLLGIPQFVSAFQPRVRDEFQEHPFDIHSDRMPDGRTQERFTREEFDYRGRLDHLADLWRIYLDLDRPHSPAEAELARAALVADEWRACR